MAKAAVGGRGGVPQCRGVVVARSWRRRRDRDRLRLAWRECRRAGRRLLGDVAVGRAAPVTRATAATAVAVAVAVAVATAVATAAAAATIRRRSVGGTVTMRGRQSRTMGPCRARVRTRVSRSAKRAADCYRERNRADPLTALHNLQ